MKKATLVGALLALGPLRLLPAKDAEPRREAGLFVHLVPRQLAETRGPQPIVTGFVISLPGESRPAPNRPAVNSAAELVAFLRGQSPGVQQNGIWLVLAYSKAYAAEEKARVVALKQACRRAQIPLFIVRDQELPKGWKRFSRRASDESAGTVAVLG